MEAKAKLKIQIPNNMRRSSSSNSESLTHLESPHSPLRFHSPLRSDQGDPPDTPPYASPFNSPEKQMQQQPPPSPPLDNSKAIVAVDKFTHSSPLTSPLPQVEKAVHAAAAAASAAPAPYSDQTVAHTVYRAVREDGMRAVRKVEADGTAKLPSIVRGRKRQEMVKIAELGFRISEVVLCLISFSVMSADKTQGWSGDSFDRYKEYRYCLSVNVIAFVYSGFQAYDLAYHLVTRKHVIRHHLRCHLNFFMDQVLAYLLISASSSAATRVDDWQSNWGKDAFTEMASASIAISFLAFVAFAASSIISGYNLCNDDST